MTTVPLRMKITLFHLQGRPGAGFLQFPVSFMRGTRNPYQYVFCRYGRVPKPTKPLNYSNEDAHSSASETAGASPAQPAPSAAKPKRGQSAAKRGRASKVQSTQESKKPKLVTLRASQSEYSDEEDEKQRAEEEDVELWPGCESPKDSSAPVFVPASLRSPPPQISEVEETMEEVFKSQHVMSRYTPAVH